MAHLVHDSNRGKQTLSYQSSWMSRWMRTSCNRTGESINHSSDASVNDLNCITKDILATSRSFKGLGMIETVTSELVNGGPRPSTESSLRNESSCRYLFEDMGASAFETGHKFECGEAIYLKNGIQLQPVLHAIPAVADNDTSFRGCHFLDAVTSKHNRLDHANLRILPHKGSNTLSQPTDFDSGQKKNCESQSNISLNDSFRESNTSLVFYTPSVRDHHFRKAQKLLCHRPSPSQYIASAKTGSEQSCFECYSVHKLPLCVHDVETMKKSTTLDSLEGGFSRTSNILFITVNFGASLSNECDILTTRRVSTKINQNIPSDLHRLSPFPGQGMQEVILESLTRSADSEGIGNARDNKTFKVTSNKVSSAEIDPLLGLC
ncbi:uncharacterized protein [Henckelia pumila]|uniref:uncharacterized protein isoform X1 n=1 Tax=Henckelia pumila TaxID=405737 RepID=UPI003C6E7FE1